MKKLQQKKIKKETQPLKVINIIEYFPGFVGYTGGGAERILERLIMTYKKIHPDKYDPYLYVASEKDFSNVTEYPFTVIEDPKKTELVKVIEEHTSRNTILHFGNTSFIEHHPELFSRIGKIWNGPIIQRITDTAKMERLLQKHQSNLLNYLGLIDAFISQSDQMTHELLQVNIPSHKIVQIENGIDCSVKKPLLRNEKECLREQLVPGVAEGIIFLFAGRLIASTKRVDELLSVWMLGGFAKKGHYLILSGNYIDYVDMPPSAVAQFLNEHSPAELTGQHIIFTGQLSEVDLENYYRISDVYVSASELEGFSNAVLEAMAFGLPVIGREGVSGYEHLIIPQETGLLFRSSTDLENKMLQLATNNVERNTIGKSAREHVEKNYSIEHMIEKYRVLYHSLIGK